MHQETTISRNYRPDIDGLRAIAVIFVVIFHAFPKLLPGGFIGVDIFFVISGFLITKIILHELKISSFSFKNFWNRRARRILPALITVLGFTYITGYSVMTATEFKNLGAHVSAGASFLSNFQIYKETGYFDSKADLNPLLHLWSLAIEEQFYILWPATLLVIYRIRQNPLKIFAMLIVLSFLANTAGVDNNPTKTFFYPGTRFWELMTGGALTYLDEYKGRCFFQLNDSASRLLSNLSLIALLVAATMLNGNTSYPGYWALVPVIATSIIITTNSTKSAKLCYLLSNKNLVQLGLISYPLYLWHWPILSFLKILNPQHGSLEILASLILSILLAAITWEFIEKPCRRSTGKAYTIPVIFGLLISLGVLGDKTMRTGGFENRPHILPFQRQLESIGTPNATQFSDGSCVRFLNLVMPKGIQCLTNSNAPTILVIGDSHAMALNSAPQLNLVNVETLAIGVHGCTPLDGYYLLRKENYSSLPSPIEGCSELPGVIRSVLTKNTQINKIIVSTRGDGYYINESGSESEFIITSQQASSDSIKNMYFSGYRNFLKSLPANMLVFIIGIPFFGKNPMTCVDGRPFSFGERDAKCEFDLKIALKKQESTRLFATKIREEISEMIVFDPLPVFCDTLKCRGSTDLGLLYADSNHLSLMGSQLLWNKIKSDAL
jgi:peptidoglycan/LPS O-acetylase OafA/YrhL